MGGRIGKGGEFSTHECPNDPGLVDSQVRGENGVPGHD